MPIEVKPEGAKAPIYQFSDEWIVMEAVRRDVEPEVIVEALEKLKDDVEEGFSYSDLCRPSADIPRPEDYLPTKKVSSVTRISDEEKAKRKAEKEARAKREADERRRIHAEIQKRLREGTM